MAATESSRAHQDSGSTARLHSSLMGLLSHLVRRLTSLGMDHPQIAQVLPFLLQHALDLRHPESEVLVEDGLQLLQIVLKRSDQLLPEYRVSPLQHSVDLGGLTFGGRVEFAAMPKSSSCLS